MLCRIVLVALVLLTTPLAADALRVGQDAPKFKAAGSIINPPEFARELKDCEGSVILVYEWNARDGTRNAMSDIQKYFDKYAGVGLYIWTIHRLNHEKFPQIDVLARENGWTMPICMGGFYDDTNDFFGYKDGKTFRTTVVGSDGKVAYYGETDGWKATLEAEVAKIVYPNLGKDVITDKLQIAAKHFAKRDFGKALNVAEPRLAEELTDEEKSDAERIIERAKWIADTRNERVAAWKEEKRYDLAMQALEALKAEFRGHKYSDDADAEMKALKKDKQIKKELSAYEALQKLVDAQGKTDPTTYMTALQQFALQREEFKAGEVAKKMASRIKADLD